MAFVINEDKALKSLLSNTSVSDATNQTRLVNVWFSQPDVEIRTQSYPYMLIDLVDISLDSEREQRGFVRLPYTPEGKNQNKKYFTEFPIPVNIDYQVSAYSRHPMHDRQILASMLTNITPFRFGNLEIPEDKTLRRLELLGYVKRDRTDENNKRLYINVFDLRVSSEYFPSKLLEVQAVSNVRLTVTGSFNRSVS